MADVSPGQLVRYRLVTQDEASGDNVGLVVEKSHTDYTDGTSTDHVIIAPLDLVQLEVNEELEIAPLGESISTPPPPEATSTSESATAIPVTPTLPAPPTTEGN